MFRKFVYWPPALACSLQAIHCKSKACSKCKKVEKQLEEQIAPRKSLREGPMKIWQKSEAWRKIDTMIAKMSSVQMSGFSRRNLPKDGRWVRISICVNLVKQTSQWAELRDSMDLVRHSKWMCFMEPEQWHGVSSGPSVLFSPTSQQMRHSVCSKLARLSKDVFVETAIKLARTSYTLQTVIIQSNL